MTPVEIKTLVREYVEAYNRGDLPRMLKVLHPEFVFSCSIAGSKVLELNGVDDFETVARLSMESIHDRHQECRSFAVDGDTATASILLRGVLAEDLPNGLKAGQRVSSVGIANFSFRDGAIAYIKELH